VTTLLRQTPPLLHTMSTIAASLQRVMPIATQGTSLQTDTSIKRHNTTAKCHVCYNTSLQSDMNVTTYRFEVPRMLQIK